MSAAVHGRPVLHVVGGLGFGGTERLCLNIVEQAARRGRSALVASLDPSRDGMEPAFRALPHTRLLRGPGRRHRDVYRWMIALLRRERPAAIFVYAFGLTHLVAALAARRAGVRPVFVSAGNTAPAGSGRWKWRLVVAGSRLLGVPIRSCSATVEASLRGLGVGLPAGSSVIANGSDVVGIAARADAARRERHPGGPLVVGMAARLDAIKDHATLIRAFGHVVRRRPEASPELWLVGDGALRPALEQLAAAEGIGEAIRFLGFRSDIPEILGQMDVYAFSTTGSEGFGIALVEAMAAGLPIVASDVAACREVIGDAGLLVAAGDDVALASAIDGLLSSEELRRSLGSRARERAAVFDIRACADAWYAPLARLAPVGERP